MDLEALLLNIQDLRETIQHEIQVSQQAGILDDSYEKYLNDQLAFLSTRKSKIVQDFKLPLVSSINPKTLRSTLPPNRGGDPDLPLKSSKSLNPFKKIPANKIFRKQASPARGNSPSAMRYSPQASPSSAKSEKIKYLDLLPNRDSPLCSTRSSASSVERSSDLKSELYRKYQEQREIRNKAHQEMLALKEQMLLERENKLEAMIKARNLEGRKRLEGKDERTCVLGVKPPLSPAFMKSVEKEKIVSFM